MEKLKNFKKGKLYRCIRPGRDYMIRATDNEKAGTIEKSNTSSKLNKPITNYFKSWDTEVFELVDERPKRMSFKLLKK